VINKDFKLPVEFESFKYLHHSLGGVKTAEMICEVWNITRDHDNVYLDSVDESIISITIKGQCSDKDLLLDVVKYFQWVGANVVFDNTVETKKKVRVKSSGSEGLLDYVDTDGGYPFAKVCFLDGKVKWFTVDEIEILD